MPSVINTNLASLNTQRNLSTSQASLNTTIQRLSSGLRINSAKDDAAGLAISERMTSQVRGLAVAQRNANDGVSLSQTAEGGLGKIGDMVQRVRELAVQSSNATNSTSDRQALQAEVTQLQSEMQRVATTTNFNGTKLLDGSFTDQNFQVGADVGQSIAISSITNAQTSSLGQLEKLSGAFDNTGGATSLAAGDLTINGYDIGAVSGTGTAGAITADDLTKAINGVASQSGVYAKVNGANIELLSANQITVDGQSAGLDMISAASGDVSAVDTTSAMNTLNISTVDGAQQAIMQADAALKTINSSRASLGAIQSRFENAISNIQIQSENLSASRSRITDTDFASETANLARSQILQQAGNAMLSQANQAPQQVMSLLR